MKVNRYLDNKIGATMFEAAVGIILLLFSILAGVDLVRLAYTTAIIQYEVVRGTRMANIEANSDHTGFGDTYTKELTHTCDVDSIYSACGTAVAGACTPELRVCGLRDYIKKNIIIRALGGELSASGWESNFTIRSVVPGAATFNDDAGNPGDLLIVDLNIPVQLVSPLKHVIGNSVTIRASSVGRNEY